MFRTETRAPGLRVQLTAHQDDEGGMLLVEVETDRPVDLPPRRPLDVSLVLDRSGSMGGRPIEVAVEALAEFVGSLAPEDQVGVVAFDDRVDVVWPKGPAGPAASAAIRSIGARGSTNLYGGWLTGAKMAGRDGRVILLSDGHANVGRFSDADSLSAHAERTYREFMVLTSTIGIGERYDEALMAGMAQRGGGRHHFAQTVDQVSEALRQERYSAESVWFTQVEVEIEGLPPVTFGAFWPDESQRRVVEPFHPADASGTPRRAWLRYRDRTTGERGCLELTMPDGFGVDETAARERWVARLARLESDMSRVNSPDDASAMERGLREVVARLRALPSDPVVDVLVGRTEAAIARLQYLMQNWDEREASIVKKSAMMRGEQIRQREKMIRSHKAVPDRLLVFNPAAEALAPRTQWAAWRALPFRVDEHRVEVAVADHQDGYLRETIERCVNRRVLFEATRHDEAELVNRIYST